MKILKRMFGIKAKPAKTQLLTEIATSAALDSEKTLTQILAEAPAKTPDAIPAKPTPIGIPSTNTKPTPAPEPTFRQGVSMRDKESQYHASVRHTKGYTLNSPISFCYQDGDGVLTDRTVTPFSYNGFSTEARCHLRNAYRTFYLDRMQDCVTMEDTGEILSIDEWKTAIQVF